MKVAKKLLVVITWLLLIYTSFELGMWQLHRAQDMNEQSAPTPDQPLISLDKVSSAGKNMPIKAVNRIVSATGNYTSSDLALDQKIDFGVLILCSFNCLYCKDLLISKDKALSLFIILLL